MKIKTNLQLSFAVIILILMVFGFLSTAVEMTLKNRYKQTIDSIISEYSITSLSTQLASTYRQLLLDISNPSLNADYRSKIAELDDIMTQLGRNVAFDDSKVIYTRLANRIGLLREYLATGLKNTAASDFTRSAETLEQINRASSDISDETIHMLLADIAHSKEEQKSIQSIERFILIVGSAMIALVLAASFVLAAFFSRRISSPLGKLSALSKSIAEGNMELSVDESILKRDDEIGILAGSFRTMVEKLKEKILELNSYNQEIQKSKKLIEGDNIYLEKANKMMVNRELAMIKLKKKVALLHESLPADPAIEQKLASIDAEAGGEEGKP